MIVAIFDQIPDPREVFIVRLLCDFEVLDLHSTDSIGRHVELQLTGNVLEVVSVGRLNAGQAETGHQLDVFQSLELRYFPQNGVLLGVVLSRAVVPVESELGLEGVAWDGDEHLEVLGLALLFEVGFYFDHHFQLGGGVLDYADVQQEHWSQFLFQSV